MAALAPFIESFPALWGETAVRSTLFLTGAFVLALVLSRATAGARHALWTGATLGLLALPFLTGGLPSFAVPVTFPVGLPGLTAPAPQASLPAHGARLMAGAVELHGEAAGGTLLAAPEIASLEVHIASHPLEEGTPAPQRTGIVLLQQTPREAGGAEADASPAGPPAATRFRATVSAPASSRSTLLALVLLVIWLGGVLGAGIPLIAGLRRARGLSRETPEIRDPEWSALMDRVRGRVGLRRNVSLRVGRAVRTPLAGGVLRPVILLPEEARGWSVERREIVLTHEAIHLRRADPLAQIIARVVVALYWFHPLAWVVAANARRAREEACDEAVVALGHRPSNYARHLIDLAPAGVRPDPVLSGIHGPQLEKRIMSILRASPESRSPLLRRTAAAVAVAAVVIWSVACAAAVSSDGPGGWERAGTLPPAPAAVAPPYPPPGVYARPALPEAEIAREYPEPPAARMAAPPGIAPIPPAAPPAPTGRMGRVSLMRVAPDAPPAFRARGMVAGLAPAPSRLVTAWTVEEFAASCEPIRVATPEVAGEGDRVMVRIVADGIALCRLSEGEVRWSADRRSIAGMDAGAWMVIEAVEGDERQRVEIEGTGGEPSYHWFVEGEARPFDAAAGEWLEAAFELLAAGAMGVGPGVRTYTFREGAAGGGTGVYSLRGDTIRSAALVSARAAAERQRQAGQAVRAEVVQMRERISDLVGADTLRIEVRRQELADIMQRLEVELMRIREQRPDMGSEGYALALRSQADSLRIRPLPRSDRAIEFELRAFGDTTRALALQRSQLAIEALVARGDREAFEAASTRFRELFERVRRD